MRINRRDKYDVYDAKYQHDRHVTDALPRRTVSDGEKPFSGKWEIESRNRAESAGTISFAISFEPGKDGTTLETLAADVQVPANSKENKVAKLIETSLSETLEDKGFKVTCDDGEKVVIKAKGDTPDFELKLTGNTVQGISLSLDD